MRAVYIRTPASCSSARQNATENGQNTELTKYKRATDIVLNIHKDLQQLFRDKDQQRVKRLLSTRTHDESTASAAGPCEKFAIFGRQLQPISAMDTFWYRPRKIYDLPFAVSHPRSILYTNPWPVQWKDCTSLVHANPAIVNCESSAEDTRTSRTILSVQYPSKTVTN